MSQSHDADDPYSHFEAAAAARATPVPHDPFGPINHGHGQAPATPAYASASLVPSADSLGSTFESELDYPLQKRPVALYAGAAAALLAGALLIGGHFVSESQAEERRLSEIAQVQRTMAELEAKRRAEEASRENHAAPAAATSHVAALLAASTTGYEAAQSPQAQKPNRLAATREAAAIQRALRGPAMGRPARLPSGFKARAKPGAAREAEDSLRENRSNDPIYGL